jgi:hypothetical protein
MLGILAFGSLIDDPGPELEAATAERREMQTPFRIEFARSSSTRGGGPTLVPVTHGGATVKATLLVLNGTISEAEAKNILWRRETRHIGTERTYREPTNPGPNRVLVKTAEVAAGKALYTDFPDAGKLANPAAEQLAELAVSSARNDEVPTELNGISYLMAAKRAGVMTPLLPGYEAEVLRLAGAGSLQAALTKLQADE